MSFVIEVRFFAKSILLQGHEPLDSRHPHAQLGRARNAASIALHDLLGFTVLETGPCFAGIEFDGGVGVLLMRPKGSSASPRWVSTLRP